MVWAVMYKYVGNHEAYLPSECYVKSVNKYVKFYSNFDVAYLIERLSNIRFNNEVDHKRKPYFIMQVNLPEGEYVYLENLLQASDDEI